MACSNCCCMCFVLVRCISELSGKLDPGFDGSWSLILCRHISSIESWNADSTLSCSVNFERWRRKSVFIVHEWPYRKFLFNFWCWTLQNKSSPCEDRHELL